MRWEYKLVTLSHVGNSPAHECAAKLNREGLDDWELVGMFGNEAIMKREAKPVYDMIDPKTTTLRNRTPFSVSIKDWK